MKRHKIETLDTFQELELDTDLQTKDVEGWEP